MSKTPFLFPLRAGDIALFCHPDPSNVLSAPYYIDGDLSAGNGYLAIKATRGLWMESDYIPAPQEAVDRISNLPWHSIPDKDHPEWRRLDDVSGTIYHRATIQPWNDKHRVTPSPVWKVGGEHNIRLSHLQLIARLPNARIYCGHATRSEPAYVLFNGGSVIIPRDKRLEVHSWEIFAPSYHCLTGDLLRPSAGVKPSYVPKPVPEQPVDDWPPADQSDD